MPASMQRAPSRRPRCARCQHSVPAHFSVVRAGTGASVVTLACTHTHAGRRCGQPYAILFGEAEPRLLFAETFDELTLMVERVLGLVPA